MTKLNGTRRIKRETEVTERKRAIIVELFPFHCGLRLKGRRDFYTVPWEVILDLARKIDAKSKLAARER